MDEATEEGASPLDPTAALLGEPVDPRRPHHMSREQYLRSRAGEQTRTALETAGLVRRIRRRRIVRALLVVAAVVGVGLAVYFVATSA